MRIITPTALFNLTLMSLGLSSALVYAQPVPVQQYDENRRTHQLEDSLVNLNPGTTNAPELYPGENQDVGPQQILRLKPRPTYFEGVADTEYAFTDNNRLAHNRVTSTAYAVNTVQLAAAPTPFSVGPGLLAPRLGFRSQWYNYGLGSHHSENSLDFDAQTAFATVQYLYHQRWEFDAEVDYTRLLNQHNYHQFYTEIAPSIGVSRIIPLRNNLLFAVGWQGAYHFTSVPSIAGSFRDVNDRLDNNIGMNLTCQASDRLVVQPFYRFETTHYPRTAVDTDRNDYFHTGGISFVYFFTRQAAMRLFATESFRVSDDPLTTSYSKFDLGLGATFVLRF